MLAEYGGGIDCTSGGSGRIPWLVLLNGQQGTPKGQRNYQIQGLTPKVMYVKVFID